MPVVWKQFLAVSLCLCSAYGHVKDDPFLYKKFPDGFMWGTATASYQIEGAWNVSGKGENIWDKFTHEGGHVLNNDTGDVACDSYNKYKEDVKLLKDMGVSHYRFSISWSRIFPDGTKSSYNSAGMQYYKDLLAELKSNSITPMGTLYHWDLPQPLEDVGGWLNESIVGPFGDYADKVFSELGSDVKLWITINEPYVVCWLGYGIGAHAPGKKDKPGVDPYVCGHNIIKAHAKAYKIYDTKYRASQQGKISITLNADWKEAKTSSDEDKAAAERAELFMLGWFAHPIYKTGDYPVVMKQAVAAQSPTNASRLPEFTAQERADIKGTNDFFGLNHYTAQIIANKKHPAGTPVSYGNDQEIEETHDPKWPSSGSSWLKVVPWGVRNLLNWIKDTYGNPDVYITENGVSDLNGTVRDAHRISFYKGYTNNVLKAINDGCKVKGYTAWSLLDNFEWHQGYNEKFGIHYVDFNDPDRPRQVKDSANWFKELIKRNGWDNPNPPITTPSATTTPSGASAKIFSSLLISVSVIFFMVLWV